MSNPTGNALAAFAKTHASNKAVALSSAPNKVIAPKKAIAQARKLLQIHLRALTAAGQPL